MGQVRVFLKTELFALTGESGHVPRGSVIIDGDVRELQGGGITIAAKGYLDARGRTLEGNETVLFIPTGKIDHLHLQES